jgi:hypothetical protein
MGGASLALLGVVLAASLVALTGPRATARVRRVRPAYASVG